MKRPIITVSLSLVMLIGAANLAVSSTDASSECWNMKYGECIESVYADEEEEMDELDIKCQQAAENVCQRNITEEEYKTVVEQLKGE